MKEDMKLYMSIGKYTIVLQFYLNLPLSDSFCNWLSSLFANTSSWH